MDARYGLFPAPTFSSFVIDVASGAEPRGAGAP